MLLPSYYKIKHTALQKDYAFFEGGDYDLNIGGIRSKDSQSNKFDDIIYVAYMTNWVPNILYFKATTDPGKYWLQNPINNNGTLILVPGQYRGVYNMGLHGRSGLFPYEALEQVEDMMYVLDNNRDATIDFDLYRVPELYTQHAFMDNRKTNLHRASKWSVVQMIERYSAGCQVIQSPKDYELLMSICRIAAKKWGPYFSYTLFEESDFN